MPEMSRIGLVLGAGGVVGHAYHAGVLAALAEATAWDARSADVIIGTSAGSYVAALLRAGFTPSDLALASMGRTLSPAGARVYAKFGLTDDLDTPGIQHADVTRGPAAAGLLLRPWSLRPGTLGAALLPAGNVSTDGLAKGIANLFGTAWPDRPTLICAVNLETGRLVVFGRRGSPPTSMAAAVAASCAIPAYFRPVVIGGARHVDGGVHSVTNADQLAGLDLDLVLVSCPMGATTDALAGGPDLPLRAAVRFQLGREAVAVRRSGEELVSFLPTPAVRKAMGNNPMDPRRRREVTETARVATLARLRHPEMQARLAALGAS
ncbi:MAG: patatin-like phospholipase family protein [Candidatus Dormibacteraceae bacterium]